MSDGRMQKGVLAQCLSEGEESKAGRSVLAAYLRLNKHQSPFYVSVSGENLH